MLLVGGFGGQVSCFLCGVGSEWLVGADELQLGRCREGGACDVVELGGMEMDFGNSQWKIGECNNIE